MDNTQQQFIQKKLLYKFDKKLDTVFQEYFKRIFQSNDNPCKLSDEQLLDQIQSLQFANFKYRTALLSSNKDLIHNQKQLMEQQSKIQQTREQIKYLQQEFQRAQVIKQNKQRFNQVGQELKKYDKKEIFDQKMTSLDEEMKELEEKYSKDMINFQSRERYLKASISALKSFLGELDYSNKPNQAETPFKSSSFHVSEGVLEDDGQIL